MAGFSRCPHMEEGVRELFYKGTNPILEGSSHEGQAILDLSTSQRPYLLIPSPFRVKILAYEWGANIQTTEDKMLDWGSIYLLSRISGLKKIKMILCTAEDFLFLTIYLFYPIFLSLLWNTVKPTWDCYLRVAIIWESSSLLLVCETLSMSLLSFPLPCPFLHAARILSVWDREAFTSRTSSIQRWFRIQVSFPWWPVGCNVK